MSRRSNISGRRLSMVQQALVELGEDPDAPVIGSADGADRPLWLTAEEKRQVDEVAADLFLELARP